MLRITIQFPQIQTNTNLSAGEGTNIGFIRRFEDKRSVEDKLYKFRYVIPKEANNSRDPVNGFIIQNSSLTGFAKTGDPLCNYNYSDDNNFRRNHQFISSSVRHLLLLQSEQNYLIRYLLVMLSLLRMFRTPIILADCLTKDAMVSLL